MMTLKDDDSNIIVYDDDTIFLMTFTDLDD